MVYVGCNFGWNCYLQSIFLLFCSGDIVCAGVFRVFGSEIAELPLVATTSDQQGQVI